MMDQELNERLLKKIGFKKNLTRYASLGLPEAYIWESPNGGFTNDIPDLVSDIGACFKWLVPELIKRGCEVIHFFYNLKNIDCDLTPVEHTYATVEGTADTESKALCLAADTFLKE